MPFQIRVLIRSYGALNGIGRPNATMQQAKLKWEVLLIGSSSTIDVGSTYANETTGT